MLFRSSKKVVRFDKRRGTVEQWIKQGKHAVKWTKLSCQRFKDNEARLQLFALAYNLANFLRQLVLPRSIRSWNLTTLREKLVKIGAKVVRYSSFQNSPTGSLVRTSLSASLDWGPRGRGRPRFRACSSSSTRQNTCSRSSGGVRVVSPLSTE